MKPERTLITIAVFGFAVAAAKRSRRLSALLSTPAEPLAGLKARLSQKQKEIQSLRRSRLCGESLPSDSLPVHPIHSWSHFKRRCVHFFSRGGTRVA